MAEGKMTKATRTIGIIGLGSIGRRHSDNLIKMGQTEVIGYDPDPAKHKGKWTCGDLNFLLKISDVFIIASPTSTHAEYLEKLTFSGKPIFLEKPVADRIPIGMNGVVMVGYNLRFHSCVKKAKEWLDAGLIGRPLWTNFTLAQWNDKPAYLRDGVCLNWSHEIDLALYLLGPATVAGSSTRLTDGKDDMTDILLTHESGCRTMVHLDYITKPEQRYFKITGTEGIIEADLLNGGNINIESEKENGWTAFCEPYHSFDQTYIEEMQAFLDRCDGKETLGATGADGLAVLDICLQVRKAAGL